jgi:hypothetical protein
LGFDIGFQIEALGFLFYVRKVNIGPVDILLVVLKSYE